MVFGPGSIVEKSRPEPGTNPFLQSAWVQATAFWNHLMTPAEAPTGLNDFCSARTNGRATGHMTLYRRTRLSDWVGPHVFKATTFYDVSLTLREDAGIRLVCPRSKDSRR